MPPFSISESLRFGWQKTRENSRLAFFSALILLVVDLGGKAFAPGQNYSAPVLGAAISSIVLEIILSTGFAIIVLKLARGQSARLREIVPSWRLFWQSLATGIAIGFLALASFAAGTIIGLGVGMAFIHFTGSSGAGLVWFAAGVIDGMLGALYVATRYIFIRFASIDGVQPLRAIIGRSAAVSQGARRQLLLFLIVMALIDVVGAVTVIGLLITIPVTAFAIADAYLKFIARIDASSPIEAGSQK